MISLNGVVLDESLIWKDDLNIPASLYSERTTIGGRKILQHVALAGGRNISLSAVDVGNGFVGEFTRGQLEAFKLLEASKEKVEFIYEDQSFLVIVLGMEVTPVTPRPNHAAEDLYFGSINLLETS